MWNEVATLLRVPLMMNTASVALTMDIPALWFNLKICDGESYNKPCSWLCLSISWST